MKRCCDTYISESQTLIILSCYPSLHSTTANCNNPIIWEMQHPPDLLAPLRNNYYLKVFFFFFFSCIFTPKPNPFYLTTVHLHTDLERKTRSLVFLLSFGPDEMNGVLESNSFFVEMNLQLYLFSDWSRTTTSLLCAEVFEVPIITDYRRDFTCVQPHIYTSQKQNMVKASNRVHGDGEQM